MAGRYDGSMGEQGGAKISQQTAELIRRLDQALSTYVRPESFPIAARLLEPGEPLPERCKTSGKLGAAIIACQAVGMARRYGWVVAVDRETITCPLAAVAFGFRKPSQAYLEGQTLLGFFCDDPEVARRWEANHPRLPAGKYDRLVVAPLFRTSFEPMVIALYGNSAQIMRLVQAVAYHTGEPVEGRAFGRLDCADLVIETLRINRPHMVLPCNGDRVFGGAQDHEMAFAFPPNWAERIITGLEKTHEHGVRYPIPQMLAVSPKMPPKYEEALEGLELPRGSEGA